MVSVVTPLSAVRETVCDVRSGECFASVIVLDHLLPGGSVAPAVEPVECADHVSGGQIVRIYPRSSLPSRVVLSERGCHDGTAGGLQVREDAGQQVVDDADAERPAVPDKPEGEGHFRDA